MNLRNAFASLAVLAVMAVPASAQTIGPDAYGYTLTRTAASAGYLPIIAAPGVVRQTPATLTRDDYTFQVPMGFGFNYYGNNFTDAFVSTNGFVAFGGLVTATGTAGGYNNTSLASPVITGVAAGQPTIERAIVAPLWDDLYFSGTQPGALYTLTRTAGPLQEFVVEWNGAQFFSAQTTPLTLQAIFRSDGSMTWYYPDVTSAAAGTNGAEASIGLHDLNGGGATNRFLQLAFNTPGALQNLDQIDVVLVPEPTSLALLGVAAVGFVVRRRRLAKA